MPHTWWLSSALVLLAGCGPFAIGLGAKEVLSSDSVSDPGAPTLEFVSATDYGTARPPLPVPPATNQATKVIKVTTNVRGVTLVGAFVDPNAPFDEEILEVVVPSEEPPPGAEILEYTFDVELEDTGTLTYRVRARDGRGRLSPRIDIVWIRDLDCPDDPAELVATATVPRRLDLSWVASNDSGDLLDKAFEYEITLTLLPNAGTAEVALDPVCVPATMLETVDATRVSLVAPLGSELKACEEYRVEIVARDRAGNPSEHAAMDVQRTRCGGDATFRPHETKPAVSPGTIRAADLDDDGILDLAFIADATVRFAAGQGANGLGNGSFAAATTLLEGIAPVFFAIGNVDIPANDADDPDRADLVVLDGERRVYVVDVLATKAPDPITIRTFSGASVPTVLALAHFNADEHLDLAVCTEERDPDGQSLVGTMHVLHGKSDGTFVEPPGHRFFVGKGAHAMVTGLFDGDALADAAVLDRDVLRIHLSTTGFSLAFAQQVGGEPHSLATGDFNADGFPDLVVGLVTGEITVLLGRGNGSFDAQTRVDAVIGPAIVEVADVTADRIADIVVLSAEANDAVVFLGGGSQGTGDGTFTRSESPALRDATLTPLTSAIGPFRSVTTGDFDSDSIVDLATTTAPAAQVAGGTTQPSVTVLLGNGAAGRSDGTFLYTGKQDMDPGTIAGTADFNVDGVADVLWRTEAIANRVDFIDLFLADSIDGQGLGTFTKSVSFSAGTVNGIGIGHFNEDDVPDIAVTEETLEDVGVTIGVRILLGGSEDRARDGALRVKPQVLPTSPEHQPVPDTTRSAGFFTRNSSRAVAPPSVISVGDLDEDGKADLAVLLPSVTEHTLFEMRKPPDFFRLLVSFASLVIRDLNPNHTLRNISTALGRLKESSLRSLAEEFPAIGLVSRLTSAQIITRLTSRISIERIEEIPLSQLKGGFTLPDDIPEGPLKERIEATCFTSLLPQFVLQNRDNCGKRAGAWIYCGTGRGAFDSDQGLTDTFFKNRVLGEGFSIDSALGNLAVGVVDPDCADFTFDEPTEMATGMISFNGKRTRFLVFLRGPFLQVLTKPLPTTAAEVSAQAHVGDRPHSLVTADLDRDGLAEALVLDDDNLVVVRLLKTDPPPVTDKKIGPLQTYEESEAPDIGLAAQCTPHPVSRHELIDLAIADLNSDRRPDIAVLARAKDGSGVRVFVFVFLQNDRGGFVVQPGVPVDPGGSPTNVESIAIADFTGDGILDIALGGDAIYLLEGQGEVVGN